MAPRPSPFVPLGEDSGAATLQRTHWRMRGRLSSVADAADRFLAHAGFDRGPWLTVAFGAGIVAWFTLSRPSEWIFAIALGLLLAGGAMLLWRERAERVHLLAACVTVGLLVAAGIGVIWARSTLIGAEPLPNPTSAQFTGYVLERIEQPAQERVRLVLAARDPKTERPIKIRVNVPLDKDKPDIAEGATVRLRARLMPPAGPMVPGGYDFARAAWFQGFAATGTVQGEVEVVTPGTGAAPVAGLQRRLSQHVRSRLDGQPGAIAAAFASGHRGAISKEVEIAMRDSGLTHLLSISGLHVSAVIAAGYLLSFKLLALWPWLVLRVRSQLVAAAIGALGGIAYTLLTGAQVPTVRSCVGAVLVLIALALGREPLSLRMLAVAAMFVMLLWPETLVGPSFQMSFAAVLAIIALHSSAPVRAFLAPREEPWIARTSRRAVMLLITGLVIELALMPIVLFHFHRAGFYGALANVIVIPLVTTITMPLIALSLALDLVGLGAPGWWLAGLSLDIMLWIADFTATRPGAVRMMPQMTGLTFALFVCGLLWLALWRGRPRLLGFAPVFIATIMLLTTPIPDILISSDGRHVGITGEGDHLLMLRDTRSDYARDNIQELAGFNGEILPIAKWPEARCNRDFCAIGLEHGGREWHVLMSRTREYVDLDDLAKACAQSDIVISDRWLPRSCEPRWLKADGRFLRETGGLSIVLKDTPQITTVASWQGEHGWWRGQKPD